MFIVVSLALFLIMAFAFGVTVLRQTKAIWGMSSTNAVTINSTLNSFTMIEPVLILVVILVAGVAMCTTKLGFGGG